jgi:hypothetical protein
MALLDRIHFFIFGFYPAYHLIVIDSLLEVHLQTPEHPYRFKESTLIPSQIFKESSLHYFPDVETLGSKANTHAHPEGRA